MHIRTSKQINTPGKVKFLWYVYLYSGRRITVVLLAKGLHHRHMATHSSLCQHTMAASLYVAEIGHKTDVDHAMHTYITLFVLVEALQYHRPGKRVHACAEDTCMNQHLCAMHGCTADSTECLEHILILYRMLWHDNIT